MIRQLVVVGEKFNRLTATAPVKGALWRFTCDCESELERMSYHVISGNTKSCGCLSKDRTIERNTTHGLTEHPLYVRWCGMKARCEAPGHVSYKNYGAVGIIVCEEWQDFSVFLRDMGMPENLDMSIERKITTGPYCKENCVWATAPEQSRNTKRNVNITICGVTKNVRDWEIHNCVRRGAYQRRVDIGWPLEKAVTLPISPGKPLRRRV